MVTIKNISSAEVTIALPDMRLRREIKPGAAMPFKDEEYEYLTFDPGFNALINGHYVKVKSDTVEVIEDEKPSMEASEIKEILEKRNITAFAKMIKNATAAEKDAIVKYATELGVIDTAFTALIKQYCGINIVEAVSQYRQSLGE